MPEPSHDPTLAWADLGGFIAPEIVRAPKTCGDPQETWPPVHWQSVRYIQGTLVGKPWANHLALVAAVLSARRYDARTVKLVLSRLHTRFKLLFQELALHQMSEWNAEHIFPSYLKGEVLAQDSTLTRERFWTDYCTASKQVWLWLKSLPESQQHQYRPFSLHLVPRLAVHGLPHFKESHQRQQQARKRETDAIVPHFAAMRAQAHLRHNSLVRLRQAYQEAVARIVQNEQSLPVEYSYEEGSQCWHFRIWDRRSFVSAHAEQYNRQTVTWASARQRGFTDERNHLFVEFVQATSRTLETTACEPWFVDLLKLGLLSDGPVSGTAEEVESKQEWLRQWGYADPERGDSNPFQTTTSGLLCWSHDSGDASFMARAQERADGVLIPVEPL